MAAERPRTTGLLRWILKLPSYVYVGPIASLLAWRCVLLLTTRGRKSGKPRRTSVSFLPLEDRVVMFSGWGERADWYRNILANPNVEVRIGRRRFRGMAQPILDPDERIRLMRQHAARVNECGPPRLTRPLANRIFDYAADIQRAVSLGGRLPMVEVRPVGTTAGGDRG